MSGVKLVHLTTVPMSLGFFRGQVGFMSGRGFEVHAVSSPGRELDEFAAQEAVTVHAVPMHRQITPLRDLVALARVWRTLRSIRPAIVHSHTPKAGLLGMLAAWLAGVPVRVYQIHGLPYETATGLRRVLLLASERVSAALAHRVLCVSQSMREMAIRDGIAAPGKCRVLANGSVNGIDAEGRFSPGRFSAGDRRQLREDLRIPAGGRVLGFVGRLVPDKGIVELLQAWIALRDAYPDVFLLLVGMEEAQSELPDAIRDTIHDDPRIRCTGQVDDPAPYYALMELLLFPTHREGFGLVAVEASAMEIPVVASRIPGCVDSVVDGETGILVAVRHVEELVRAVRTYLEDPQLRRRHGLAGRSRVLRDFRREVIWSELHDEYAELLAAHRMPSTAESAQDSFA